MLFLRGCARYSQCYHVKQMIFFRRCIAVNTITKEETAIQLRDERVVQIREPTADDGKEMFSIVKESEVVYVHSSYSYLLWTLYFYKTFIVASCEYEVIWFVSGFLIPDSRDIVYVWQVSVDPKFRGH